MRKSSEQMTQFVFPAVCIYVYALTMSTTSFVSVIFASILMSDFVSVSFLYLLGKHTEDGPIY